MYAATLLSAEDLERLRQLFGSLADAGSDSGSDTDSQDEPDREDGTGTGSATDAAAEAEGTGNLSGAFFKRVAPAKEGEVELLSRLAFQLVMARELRGLAQLMARQQAPWEQP